MFVGRDNLISQILRGAAQERGAFHLTGGLGSGKTSVLQRLDAQATAFSPVLVNMEDFNPGHHGDAGDEASVGAVQGSFLHFKRFLTTLIEQHCSAEVLSAFKEDVTAAFNREVAGRRVFDLERAPGLGSSSSAAGVIELDHTVYSLEEAIKELRRALRPKDLADAWRGAARAISASFVARWNEWPSNSRMLLLDNVDEVANQEMGVWLGPLLSRLDRTVVVITRQPEGALPPWPAGQPGFVVALEIPHFDNEEVQAYLARRVSGRVSDPDVRMVYRITGGHPGTVAIVHNLLWGLATLGDADRERALRDLPDQASERTAVLVERLVEFRDDAMMARALRAAVVPRRFGSMLLGSLLIDPPASGDEVKRVFEELARFPFTEAVTSDGSILRIHSYVRNGLLDRMQRHHTAEFRALHRFAAEHYNDIVIGKTEGVGSLSYGDAYVYEDPEWQRSKREWLYHSGHASDDTAKEQFLLEFARVFLEAFWWWGNYVHFDFCDQLVADLKELVRRRNAGVDGSPTPAAPLADDFILWPDLGLFHRAISDILREYPPRSGKTKDANWQEVRDALLELENVCGLRNRRPSMTRDQRQVAALIDVFLAHTWRYQAPDRPQAETYYLRAGQGFSKVGETWSVAWVCFERAEMRLERGGDERTEGEDTLRSLWLDSANMVQRQVDEDGERSANDEGDQGGGDDPPDEELASGLHRLRGDCCWVNGDRRRAATWYGRAVLHSYLFHLVGGPPDEYTMQFYVDIRARALSRLLELWPSDDQAALDFAEEMARVLSQAFGTSTASRDELSSLIGAAKLLPLALALFPRGPDVTELGNESKLNPSAFRTEFLRHHSALDQKRAATDLHDQNWP